MRKLLLTWLFASICIAVFAQTEEEANPVIITTYHATPVAVGDTIFKNVNIDSLFNYYMDKGIRPNTLIKNFRFLGHYWGDDSYQIKFIYEIDGFANINKAETKTTELINASFKTEAEKKLFWRRWNRIFDRHEDNIMSDWIKPKM